MRIVIFNCKYSENLGDGLIAETLEATLRALRPGVDVHTCDLAGRTDYGQATMPSRSRALSVLSRLPQAARRQAVATVLGRRLPELREAWRARLRGADLAIFGGGQLFQDGDLNFPMKLGAAFELCADVKVPVAIHAVGVSREWSRRGTALFHRLLATDCLSVSVRDRDSQLSWAGHFRGTRLAQALVVPDPVLAMLVKPPEPGSAVGLNVTDPLLLRYHSGSRTQAGEIASVLRNVVRHVTARGREVVLFTNGASEDEAFLDQIVDGSPASEVRRAPRPRVPADLVATQGEVAAVIGHRLHANILAYRLGLPSVGLGWDRKLESFFAETGRSAFFVPHTAIAAPRIVSALDASIAAGADDRCRDALASAAFRGVADLLRRCGARAAA